MRRRFLSAAAASAVAAAALAMPASGMAAAKPAATPAAKTPTTHGPVTPGPAITLLTGDTVRLDKAADGTQTGTVVKDASGRHNIVFQQMNGDLYALNGQIIRLIGQGKLDRRLFDLTLLAKDGYDDAHTKQLPVITTYQPGHVAPKALAGVRWMAKQSTLPSIRAQAQSVRKDSAAAALADLTRSGSGVAKVWLDGKAHTSLDVTVPAVGAPSAWAAGYTGKGVKVAVLDTGIDATHPDLKGRVVAQHRFVDGDPSSVDDDNGHGTHVASTIAGTGAASGGKYRGVASDASLVVGKICDKGGGCFESAIIAGMQWAADQGAKVVNLSVGGYATDGGDPESQALNKISDASGTLFVVAAGNSGGPRTVGTPACADRALAVGAMTKIDTPADPRHVADYSSRGPRVGDFAIKPEIAAPGGGVQDGSFTPGASVVAARAAHGWEGAAVDQYYTAMAGTSMATPHVAGGAVLLVQQHPDWTPGQLKDALVSSADPTNLAHDPVIAQGGGMLDLKKATANGLVATGSLNLGRFEPPYGTTSGTVTFRNPGSKAVHADLKLNLFRMDQQQANDTAFTPGNAVTVSPSAVDVPAGATATATVTVNLADTGLTLGSYYGYVEADVAGADTVRTTIGFTKDPQQFKLAVRANDRQGVPVTTVDTSFVDLMDLKTGQSWGGWFDNGVASFWDLGHDPRITPGKYAVIGNIGDFSPAPVYWLTAMTFGGDPELNLTKDTTLTLDARQGKRVTFNTHRPAEPSGLTPAALNLIRRISTAPGGWTPYLQQTFQVLPDIYFLPSGNATTGTFTADVYDKLVGAPSLTMAAHGHGVPATLHARYAIDYCFPGLCVGQFRSPGRYPVVDAGTGTPGELAAAKVSGKVAVVHESATNASLNLDYSSPYAANAAAAGAAGMLFVVNDAGPNWRYAMNHNTIPVAVLTHAEGEQLATAAKAGAVTITTGGYGTVSPYAYNLHQQITKGFPDNPTFQANPETLATVTARYHTDTPGAVYQTLFGAVRAPLARPEYTSPGNPGTDYFVDPFVEDGQTTLELPYPVGHLAAGQKVTADYWAGPIAPGWYSVLNAENDYGGYAIGFPGFVRWPIGTTRLILEPGDMQPPRIRVLHNGQTLCDQNGDTCRLPNGDSGRYQVQIDDINPYRKISTATHTVWDVNATFPTQTGLYAPLPTLALAYDVPLDLLNSVTAGSEYTIKVKTAYQDGSTSSGPFTLHAWASNDGGTTWTDLGTHKTDETGQAPFHIRTPKGTKAVTLRVTATDTNGNSIDQTITNAWNVR